MMMNSLLTANNAASRQVPENGVIDGKYVIWQFCGQKLPCWWEFRGVRAESLKLTGRPWLQE